MNHIWRWVPRLILAGILLFFLLSIWTLLLPNHGSGMMSFGVMFPIWLLTIALAVLFVTFQEE